MMIVVQLSHVQLNIYNIVEHISISYYYACRVNNITYKMQHEIAIPYDIVTDDTVSKLYSLYTETDASDFSIEVSCGPAVTNFNYSGFEAIKYYNKVKHSYSITIEYSDHETGRFLPILNYFRINEFICKLFVKFLRNKLLITKINRLIFFGCRERRMPGNSPYRSF